MMGMTVGRPVDSRLLVVGGAVVHAVFISYAAVDASAAEAVCHTLEAAGITCWMAPRDVAPGGRYAEAIVDAIRAARAFVLVFSAAANASEQVEREVDRAVAGGLPILPLRIEDVVPSRSLEYYLAGQHWLDALTVPLETPLERLVDALRAMLAGEPTAAAPAPAATRSPPPAPASSRDERKVVTTLFCDLVAFTAMSEAADPEDVDALLREYFARATKVIESHGGTVEKFIGDAVVGVFGVPAVHEDDPVRAVRAGLRIIEAIEGMTRPDGSPLEVRVGINTGEVLVRLDVDPASGRGFLTGDAVNTAARLEAAAPPGGVVIGETTYGLAGRSFDCEALAPVAAKGKSAPVAAWFATAARARVGNADRDRLTPLVDREVELAFLRALFDKAVAAASPQLALIVGEPGIGKSRLVAELLREVGARPELVTWRQGRCLPYGEGVTFWALSEIVKAHADILETDDRDTLEAKLEAVLPEGEDRAWFRQRLRALLGLEAAKVERAENFTAWLRFLEEIASRGSTVLVLEDLHWADEALLDFLEFFASHVAQVPLLLVATARPELFETHPSFAAVGRVNRVVLEPLTEKETETLVASLVEELAKDVRATIARHAEGNPFYAEESARLISDTVAGGPSEGAAVAATVQAVIAARLDTLEPALKAALSDASVVGEVFWDGALAALGERLPEEVDAALRELVAKQLVHRVRSSSMAGEREFVFGHALAREVAYGELPRAVKAKKHAAVAAWTEGKAGDRAADVAELLGHHYATALELARAAGDTELAESLAESAVRYLTLAGDRSWPLGVAVAERYYARALELAGADSPERPPILAKWGRAVIQRGRPLEAVAALEEAVVGLRGASETSAAARAQLALAEAISDADEKRCLELVAEAVASLKDEGPSPELLAALNDLVATTWGGMDSQAALELAERAIAVSEALGSPPDPRAVCYRGCARCDMGDAGGLDDLKQALEMVRTAGTGEHAGLVFWAAACEVCMFEGFRSGLEVNREGLQYARRRGDVDMEFTLRTGYMWNLGPLGEWDALLSEALAVEPLLEAGSYLWLRAIVYLYHLQVLVHQGRNDEAKRLAPFVIDSAHRELGHTAAACASVAAAERLAGGDGAAALRLLALAETAYRRQGGFWWCDTLPLAVRTALAAGDGALAEKLAESIEPLQPATRHAVAGARALVRESHGEHEAAASAFADAAARWREFEMPYEEAQALLGQGRCLVALGRAPEAAAPLAAAREIFARLGAKPALAKTDALLGQAGLPPDQ